MRGTTSLRMMVTVQPGCPGDRASHARRRCSTHRSSGSPTVTFGLGAAPDDTSTMSFASSTSAAASRTLVLGARTVRLTCRRFPVMESLPASTTSRQAPSSNRLRPLLGPERTDEGDSVGNGVGTAKARSLPGGVLRACDLRRGWDLNPRRTNALTSLAGKRDRPDSATSPMLSERAYLLSRGAPPRRAPQGVRSARAVPAVSACPRRDESSPRWLPVSRRTGTGGAAMLRGGS
jgi:hypothetical protein